MRWMGRGHEGAGNALFSSSLFMRFAFRMFPEDGFLPEDAAKQSAVRLDSCGASALARDGGHGGTFGVRA
jgi:hypothetical protein